MDYRRFGNTILVRMDRGEEIHEQLRLLAEAEHIRLASIQALGAVDRFTAGVYDLERKEFCANCFTGSFEIVSLTGTIDTMGGAYYAHLHMSAGNARGEVFGGHLKEAWVSATCEMVVTVIDGTIDRIHDAQTGLNLFHFRP